jgi:hypothetical protein
MQDKLYTFHLIYSYVSELRILRIGCAEDRSVIAKVQNIVYAR